MSFSSSRLMIPASPELQHDSGERYCLIGVVGFDSAGPILAEGKRRFVEHDSVVVDLSLADAASTAGLAVLMEWAAWCDAHGIQLVYQRVRPDILAVARLNGVEPMLPIALPDTDSVS